MVHPELADRLEYPAVYHEAGGKVTGVREVDSEEEEGANGVEGALHEVRVVLDDGLRGRGTWELVGVGDDGGDDVINDSADVLVCAGDEELEETLSESGKIPAGMVSMAVNL